MTRAPYPYAFRMMRPRPAVNLDLSETMAALLNVAAVTDYSAAYLNTDPYLNALELGLVPLAFTTWCRHCGRHTYISGALTDEFVARMFTAQPDLPRRQPQSESIAPTEYGDNFCAVCIDLLYYSMKEPYVG